VLKICRDAGFNAFTCGKIVAGEGKSCVEA